MTYINPMVNKILGHPLLMALEGFYVCMGNSCEKYIADSKYMYRLMHVYFAVK